MLWSGDMGRSKTIKRLLAEKFTYYGIIEGEKEKEDFKKKLIELKKWIDRTYLKIKLKG